MTYCVGIITRSGLVIASDSRTNAGVDYISTYQKLFDFSCPEERVLILCSSGNLSITQAVITVLEKDIKTEEAKNMHNLPTLYEVARYVGSKLREIQSEDRKWLEKDRIDFHCSLLLGGQIKGQSPELYLIYTQGNCIHATKDTTFLQIGETKYGKPILDRTLNFDTDLEAAAKCALLSIDSTMKSNISVGPPIDLIMYETESLAIKNQLRLALGDPYLAKIRKLWETSVKEAFEQMPHIEWQYQRNTNETVLID